MRQRSICSVAGESIEANPPHFGSAFGRDITMIAFLDMLESARYSGVEEYVKRFADLSDEDIITIRRNLLVPAADANIRSKA